MYVSKNHPIYYEEERGVECIAQPTVTVPRYMCVPYNSATDNTYQTHDQNQVRIGSRLRHISALLSRYPAKSHRRASTATPTHHPKPKTPKAPKPFPFPIPPTLKPTLTHISRSSATHPTIHRPSITNPPPSLSHLKHPLPQPTQATDRRCQTIITARLENHETHRSFPPFPLLTYRHLLFMHCEHGHVLRICISEAWAETESESERGRIRIRGYMFIQCIQQYTVGRGRFTRRCVGALVTYVEILWGFCERDGV